MSGVLSTMRYEGDLEVTNKKNKSTDTTVVFESSDNDSESSSSYDSDFSDLDREYEETAEDREATEFLNNLLKNQSQKDGDLKRINALLVTIYSII
jgi:hypothetical protein